MQSKGRAGEERDEDFDPPGVRLGATMARFLIRLHFPSEGNGDELMSPRGGDVRERQAHKIPFSTAIARRWSPTRWTEGGKENKGMKQPGKGPKHISFSWSF